MSLNKNLFHLGNKVVELRQKNEKRFNNSFPGGSQHELGEIVGELLELINDIRLAVQQEPQNIEPDESWAVKIKCKKSEISAVREQFDRLGLNYQFMVFTSQN